MNKKAAKAEKKGKECVIQTKGVMKCYGEEDKCVTTVLQDVDICIEKGNFVSIMGPSGSGKTTLLDIIGCLLKPTQGDVFIDGVRTAELSDDELALIRREKIGFVFQQYNLIQSATALENVSIAMRIAGKSSWEARDKAKRLLEMVGLKDRLNNRPSELSGGEQQRVAIARSLANDPKIILGDEPTGNLDTKTGQVVLNILKKLNEEEGYTIVVVTHDSRIAQYTDKIINLLDGRVSREDHPNNHNHVKGLKSTKKKGGD